MNLTATEVQIRYAEGVRKHARIMEEIVSPFIDDMVGLCYFVMDITPEEAYRIRFTTLLEERTYDALEEIHRMTRQAKAHINAMCAAALAGDETAWRVLKSR